MTTHRRARASLPFPSTVDQLVGQHPPVRSSLAWILAIGAVYGLWYCALFSPIVFGGMLFPSDGQLAAFFTAVHLWNPLPLAGMPGVAEPHLAQLYPVRWLFASLPKAVGFNLFVIFSYTLASGLTFGYVYLITRSRLAASAAGLIFGTSGYMIAHLGHTGLFAAVAWMPLTLWSLERLRLAFSTGWFAIGALSIAMTIVAGHPQAFVYSIYLGAAYAIFLGATAAIGWTRYVGAYVAMVAIGGALAAAHLLPMLELADLSVRGDITFDAFREYALPVKQLPMLLFPYLFGGGLPPTFEPYFGQWNLSEISGYVGMLTLMLAAIGVLRCWRTSLGAFWLGVAVISLLLALGDATPLLRLTYYMPVIDKLRAPARHLQETTFALAVLAALGLNALRTGGVRWALVRAVIASAAAVVAMSLTLIGLFYGRLEAKVRAAHELLPTIGANPALWIPVLAFFLSALILLTWARHPRSRIGSAALIAVLAADLAGYAWFGEWRYGTPVSNLEIPGYAERYRNELLKTHQRAMPMLGWQEPALAFSTVMSQLYGVPSVAGYGPLLQQRYAELSLVTNGGWIDPAALESANRAPDLLAARYIVAPKAAPIIRDVRHRERWNVGDLSIKLGSGCAANNSRQLHLALPEAARFDEIDIVSFLSCATNLTQGEAVANVSLIGAEGGTQTRTLRVGDDTAEWAIDCADVKPFVRHLPAAIFDHFKANRGAAPCDGNRYVTTFPVSPGRYREIIVDWLAPTPASLRIAHLSLVDRAAARAYYAENRDQRFADRGRFEHVEDIGTTSIYQNTRAMPRAWLVAQVVTAKPEEILRAVHTSVMPDGQRYDPYTTAFVEEPLTLGDAHAEHSGSAVVKRIADDDIEIVTSAATPTLLVLSDVYYPGWVASVDGHDTRILRTDYALRGVPVPQGEHVVVFRYRPMSFYTGVGISLTTLVAVVLLVARARRRALTPRNRDQLRRFVPMTTQL